MRGPLSRSRCRAATILVALPLAAAGQSADDVNKANNPLTPTVGLSVQDYYTTATASPSSSSTSGWNLQFRSERRVG